jgi:hypothetical protein
MHSIVMYIMCIFRFSSLYYYPCMLNVHNIMMMLNLSRGETHTLYTVRAVSLRGERRVEGWSGVQRVVKQ